MVQGSLLATPLPLRAGRLRLTNGLQFYGTHGTPSGSTIVYLQPGAHVDPIGQGALDYIVYSYSQFRTSVDDGDE